VGFVAATYHRGVPWIALPTTTLAMLDAAVGGKTGVDTGAGKNLVGAFHPPTGVLMDPMVLKTLPERLYREGLAEAVKHAAILDETYGAWMVAAAPDILARNPLVVSELVRRSVVLKAEVVSGDEHEGGRRAILNAGHTIGHALEMATDYMVPHGEAVAIGLVVETRLAENAGIAAEGTARQIIALLRAFGLPVDFPGAIDLVRFRKALHSDKKNRGREIHAAFIRSMGHADNSDQAWTQPLNAEALHTVLGFPLPFHSEGAN
jgi:3-dehydroquinate synthase